MYACALEILLVLPLRRDNLVALRLDENLYRPSPKGLIQEIRISAGSVKNRTPIQWPIERQTAEFLELYITKYRPQLVEADSQFLFPGKNGGHRNASEFGSQLSEFVEENIGAKFNPHLARHFGAVRYLIANPGSYEVVAIMLGHKNPMVTRQFYCGLERDAAARHANAGLIRARAKARVIPIGAYHNPVRKNPHSKKNPKGGSK